MIDYLKQNIEKLIFFIALVVFVGYKIPHLSEPLFWDELGVYGKSIFSMLDNTIGFQPKYLEPELSRGHPMLYVFLTASFTKLFGSNVFAMHLFNLLLSVSVLFSIFYIGAKLWNQKVGLFASLLLVAQPLFIAQSVLVLPEMMLALFALWSVYFFLKEKWILYFISLSLAMMTKETAIFLPPVLGFVLLFWQLIFNRKLELKKVLIVASPLLTFFAFLLLQKIQNGWYFFPYHNPFEGQKGFFDIEVIYLKAKDFLQFLFIAQSRNYSFYLALIVGAILFFTFKKDAQYKLIVLLGVVFGLVLFSATNYYMNRYTLLALPITALIFAYVFSQMAKSKPYFQYAFIGFLMVCTLVQIKSQNFTYDEDMSYLDYVHFQKDLTLFLEKQEDWKDGLIITCNFPLNFSFGDKRYGFSSKNYNIEMHSEVEKDSEYIIITNPGSWHPIEIPSDFVQIPFPDKGFSSAKVYKKITLPKNSETNIQNL